MADRSADWVAQAERDLDQARASQRDGRHEWAFFAAQQSAEKAVKALHLSLGQDARNANGHPEGAPFEHYGSLQSNLAIEYAGEILAFVRARLARP